LIEETEKMDKIFDDLYQQSSLPREPQRTKADKLCIDIISEKFGISSELPLS